MDWHIGCSGFHYKHWKGIFYPEKLPQTRWFEFYSQHFRTLELNVTFYRFPQLSVLRQWHAKAPAGFRFSVKAPRAITHFKQFHGTVDMITDFYTTIREGLQEKLGPVLFQLPPRLAFAEGRLRRIMEQLDPGFDNVLEFRHASWWRQDVFDQLGQRQIAFCGMSHPDLPDQLIINCPTVYYRFHGVPELYRSDYDRPALQQVINQVSHKQVKEGWFYFNNDAAGAAIPNAQLLLSLASSAC